MVEPSILKHVVLTNVPANISSTLDPASISVLVDRVQAIASGFGVSDQPLPYEVAAAAQLAKFESIGNFAKLAVVISAPTVKYFANDSPERNVNRGEAPSNWLKWKRFSTGPMSIFQET